MIFREKELEIVIRQRTNGDARVESNARDVHRIIVALRQVARELEIGMNRRNGQLVLPSNHVAHYEKA